MERMALVHHACPGNSHQVTLHWDTPLCRDMGRLLGAQKHWEAEGKEGVEGSYFLSKVCPVSLVE